MIPADQVFRDILQHWDGEYGTIQELFQLGESSPEMVLGRFHDSSEDHLAMTPLQLDPGSAPETNMYGLANRRRPYHQYRSRR